MKIWVLFLFLCFALGALASTKSTARRSVVLLGMCLVACVAFTMQRFV